MCVYRGHVQYVICMVYVEKNHLWVEYTYKECACMICVSIMCVCGEMHVICFSYLYVMCVGGMHSVYVCDVYSVHAYAACVACAQAMCVYSMCVNMCGMGM